MNIIKRPVITTLGGTFRTSPGKHSVTVLYWILCLIQDTMKRCLVLSGLLRLECVSNEEPLGFNTSGFSAEWHMEI
jgi:hypothetical protein